MVLLHDIHLTGNTFDQMIVLAEVILKGFCYVMVNYISFIIQISPVLFVFTYCWYVGLLTHLECEEHYSYYKSGPYVCNDYVT